MPSAATEARQKRVMDEAKLAVLKEAQKWKDAFGTTDGKKALELLKKEFYDTPVIANSDPSATQIRAAKRDLVRLIMDRLEYEGD